MFRTPVLRQINYSLLRQSFALRPRILKYGVSQRWYSSDIGGSEESKERSRRFADKLEKYPRIREEANKLNDLLVRKKLVNAEGTGLSRFAMFRIIFDSEVKDQIKVVSSLLSKYKINLQKEDISHLKHMFNIK